jgi:hypothetical protein
MMLLGHGPTTRGLFLLACLLASACRVSAKLGEPNPKATFRGYGECRFEGNYFIACGSKVPFSLKCHEPSMERFLDVQASCDVRPCSDAGIYVELEGVLSPEGDYGHFGWAKHALTPTRIHYASTVGPSTCDWTDPDEWVTAWTEWSKKRIICDAPPPYASVKHQARHR